MRVPLLIIGVMVLVVLSYGVDLISSVSEMVMISVNASGIHVQPIASEAATPYITVVPKLLVVALIAVAAALLLTGIAGRSRSAASPAGVYVSG